MTTDFQGEIKAQYKNLHKFAMRLTKDTEAAQDLLHDTILRVLEKQSYFQEDSNFFSWSSKIMFNLFVTQYRKAHKRESQYDPEPYIAALTSNTNPHATCELNEHLEKVNKLNPDQKAAMIGCMLGCSYGEIAITSSIPTGTVRSRLSRARQAIRDME